MRVIVMHTSAAVGVGRIGEARGRFAYAVDTEMPGYDRAFAVSSKIQTRIDLRMALMPGHSLVYPPRVMRYLYQVPFAENHYFRANLPSIAFAFGLKRPEAWYVFVMQSDLTSRGPSYVREHFRGWRHVLFANIVKLAAAQTRRVYLCQAADVERARVRPCDNEAGLSRLWADVYDKTAREWGMTLAPVTPPVNVQVLRRRAPVYADRLHELRLEEPRSGESRSDELRSDATGRTPCTGTP
jgi:hypothetical protein